MYRVVVFDDDEAQSDAIVGMVKSSPQGDAFSVHGFSDVGEFEAYAKNTDDIDVLVMDIKFEGTEADGIGLVKKWFPKGCGVQTIYVTGFAGDYHTSVYQTAHVYFLEKPLKQEELDAALKQAVENVEASRCEPIVVPFRGTLNLVRPEKVLYVESDRRKVRFNLQDSVVETYSTLSDVEEQLPATFLRCHKSFLVNTAYIESVGKTGIVLTNGLEIPVSQNRRAHVREGLASCVRSLL